jgi:hypothetical protein
VVLVLSVGALIALVSFILGMLIGKHLTTKEEPKAFKWPVSLPHSLPEEPKPPTRAKRFTADENALKRDLERMKTS